MEIPKLVVKDAPLRLGRFKVSQELLMQDWKQLLPLMASMVVVRCELHFWPPTFEYEALSEMFDVLPLGVVVPEYRIICTREGDSLTFRAEKI
jgi:membrane protein CcdC involved in cytochrome C biogenesis